MLMLTATVVIAVVLSGCIQEKKDVNIVGDFVSSAGIQKVFKATVTLTRFRLREKVSKEEQDALTNITKNWLQRTRIRKGRIQLHDNISKL